MSTSEFPSNSKNPQPGADPKKVERVTSSEVIEKKKSLGKRFRDVFIGGDSKSVVHYIVMEVLVPQAKDMITEAASQGFERLIYGESRPSNRGRNGATRPTSGVAGYTNYSQYAARGNNPIGRSGQGDRPATAQPRSHGIGDILLATRPEADLVLDHMYDLIREYANASVSDLYSLIGWTSSYTDQKWGWTDLTGSGVQRVRDGYILNLPKPLPLD